MAVHQSRAAADSAPHPHSGTLSRKPQRRSLRQAARSLCITFERLEGGRKLLLTCSQHYGD